MKVNNMMMRESFRTLAVTALATIIGVESSAPTPFGWANGHPNGAGWSSMIAAAIFAISVGIDLALRRKLSQRTRRAERAAKVLIRSTIFAAIASVAIGLALNEQAPPWVRIISAAVGLGLIIAALFPKPDPDMQLAWGVEGSNDANVKGSA